MSRTSKGWVRAAGRMVVALGVAALSLAACANRPSSAELSESILRAAADDPSIEVTPEQATCIADRLLESDLSDTTMSGLAEDFDNPEVLAAEVNRVEPAVATAAADCIG